MLGVGMLVDNAVVVIENIHRYEGMGHPAPVAARLGARQVALAVVASTATSIFVWSWLFVSERNTMIIIISEVALTICLAVACSLLISLTFIPLAAARFAPAEKPEPGIVVRKVVPAYRRVLNWTLDHRLVTLTCLFVVAGSAAWPIMKIEKSGDIPDQTREVPIFARVHDDVSKEVLEGYVDQVEEWVFSRKEELGFDSVYSWYTEHGFCMTRVYLPETRPTPRPSNVSANSCVTGCRRLPASSSRSATATCGATAAARTGAWFRCRSTAKTPSTSRSFRWRSRSECAASTTSKRSGGRPCVGPRSCG